LTPHIENLRKGYFSVGGDFDEWKRVITVLLDKQPHLSILMAAAAGSILRPMGANLSPSWIHINGGSSVGKTMALKIMVSLRTNPETIVWCFADGTILKVYTQAADGHFLCLDNAMVAIIPDGERSARPIPPAYLHHMSGLESDNTEPSVTIITTADKKASFLSEKTPVLEIDAEGATPLWVNHPHEPGWWMDKWVPYLYENYGWVTADIQRWYQEHPQDYEATIERWKTFGYSLSRLPKGLRDLLVLMDWGMSYLQSIGVAGSDEDWRKTAKSLVKFKK
jgi:hypothetical protein